MNRLPAEILVSIVSLLSVSDKLECIRVCKRWHELITSTVLYEKIKFHENCTKLLPALSLFKRKKYTEKYVRHLSLLAIDVDMQIVSTLPTLFPNIKSLAWTDRGNSIDDSLIPSYEVFTNWNNLEEIYQYTTAPLSISTHLLKAGVCNSLKDLTIISDDYEEKILKELIANIHNAPLLEKISLSGTTIKMTDLENLHNKLSELKKVELNDVHLDDEEVGLIVIKPAERVQSFTLHFSLKNGYDVIPIEFQRVIANWLFYIGRKYQYVQKLDMYLHDDIDAVHETSSILEEALAVALSNMNNLNSYAVKVCPLTKLLFETFDMNGIKLKELRLESLKGNEQVAQFFENMQSSKSTSALETLRLDIYGDVDITVFARMLTDMKLDYYPTCVNIFGKEINSFHVFKSRF